MNLAYISLGSNIGNRLEFLQEAVGLLKETKQIEVKRMSSVYETDPVGYVDQAAFLNIVVELETLYTPHELLKKCNEIEDLLGRKRLVRWGPRTVDLDILLYNEENMKTEDLIIPHPRMTERGFVLVPLVEINSELVHPSTKQAFSNIVHDQKEGVHLWKSFDGVDAFVHFEG
ncbi:MULTISPECIES: 2-amino-4-hydroxy-6-hydroxymethyldihydropteridine diphosphokinase [Psychrobacillus]|uniref:2-amino-4-hydroxy-6-hydroxymethyldihydropteridine diphosphokinase n=1 Tax=Psychrobacillus faecigallinarum TaxID=2762235 RepID=A0ABR8REW8_9BACI|nr:2-amino-4-hydroxy-6-hydroxymethyldihydropteridine diphosphokinase [Psychrobacillus faecigallinarum]MBD7946235.1 2-amino-4-hydroxy-6-hydroxymethyldihydropteridine diphosphokinase [Psychrobacillus faecigallinarum]QGM31829.1 2-amino-4-hydroxy-6-hydroxymethyldihydropteridine diphosphokinase [Bacillus sp. N3536]